MCIRDSFETKANENFSVEIEALTLVMEQYNEDTESGRNPFLGRSLGMGSNKSIVGYIRAKCPRKR